MVIAHFRLSHFSLFFLSRCKSTRLLYLLSGTTSFPCPRLGCQTGPLGPLALWTERRSTRAASRRGRRRSSMGRRRTSNRPSNGRRTAPSPRRGATSAMWGWLIISISDGCGTAPHYPGNQRSRIKWIPIMLQFCFCTGNAGKLNMTFQGCSNSSS